jgi:hypothetical protein
MVWEVNTSVILNLTKEFENGRVGFVNNLHKRFIQLKCEKYWPDSTDTPVTYGNFKVSLKEVKENPELITRTLEMSNTKVSRCQFAINR